MKTPLSTVLDVLAEIAPLELAESWDNVGLLTGDQSQAVSRAMLTIDYTPVVAAEARDAGCELVIAYHPPIFSPLKRVTADRSTDLIHDAIRRGVAIYSPHTALDVANGGTNDVLADAIAMVDRKPLRARESAATHCKFVTFVPADAVEKVSDAIFAAGAGKIGGNYSKCSFRTEGVGTFQGDEASNPTVGKAGVFERTPEVKIETVLPLASIDAVVRALNASHPYEEPAFDLTALRAPPTATGIGRVGRLPSAITLEMVANLLKRSIGVDRLVIAGDRERMIDRLAVCAGAGGDLLDAAIAAKADLYITGELRHHDALKALRAGVSVICTLHSNSERVTLLRLANRLRAALEGVEFRISEADRDPFTIA